MSKQFGVGSIKAFKCSDGTLAISQLDALSHETAIILNTVWPDDAIRHHAFRVGASCGARSINGNGDGEIKDVYKAAIRLALDSNYGVSEEVRNSLSD